jgi:threonine 3-dehydrogenase
VDDSLARKDWGWRPDYDADKFFNEYFLPEIKKRYQKASTRTIE